MVRRRERQFRSVAGGSDSITMTFLMAVAMKDAIRAVVPDPKTSLDHAVRSAYQIARLIRNAFAHAPFAPTWSIHPDCCNTVFTVPDIISLDTTPLQGVAFDWRHYGGPLALLRLCRFVRFEILKDTATPRKDVPIPSAIGLAHRRGVGTWRIITGAFCSHIRPANTFRVDGTVTGGRQGAGSPEP